MFKVLPKYFPPGNLTNDLTDKFPQLKVVQSKFLLAAKTYTAKNGLTMILCICSRPYNKKKFFYIRF